MTKTSVTMNDEIVSGVLHAYVAFDWGEEVDLVQAAKLLEAELGSASSPGLPRRRRTPMSIEYRPHWYFSCHIPFVNLRCWARWKLRLK